MAISDSQAIFHLLHHNGQLLLHCSSPVVPSLESQECPLWCEIMGVDTLLLDSQVSSLTLPIVYKQIYFTGLML
ncbi:hypothetical protein IGI04_007994 [Brassica rapa subsp. trilocularis]|uniref:Uncharacterized protein n=1 Tax=Brassica rapa subsp. trilocularis TaxID=1813537 RepID=A0ABQ7NLJ3_BRACM|nr:hypothetical protein IGI04_007994 [Brassica rapa subsp. trilocularis]